MGCSLIEDAASCRHTPKVPAMPHAAEAGLGGRLGADLKRRDASAAIAAQRSVQDRTHSNGGISAWPNGVPSRAGAGAGRKITVADISPPQRPPPPGAPSPAKQSASVGRTGRSETGVESLVPVTAQASLDVLVNYAVGTVGRSRGDVEVIVTRKRGAPTREKNTIEPSSSEHSAKASWVTRNRVW